MGSTKEWPYQNIKKCDDMHIRLDLKVLCLLYAWEMLGALPIVYTFYFLFLYYLFHYFFYYLLLFYLERKTIEPSRRFVR